VDQLKNVLQHSSLDILLQQEVTLGSSREVNTGFYIARSTPYLIDLIRKAICMCENSMVQNDQTAVNALLAPEDFGIRWGVLPACYYARSHGFPPRRDIVLHHANVTSTVREKAVQLERVQKLISGNFLARWSAIASEALDYASSGRLFGMLWRRFHQFSP